MASEAVPAEAPEGNTPTRKDPVASVAAQVAVLPTGDCALLRRLFLTQASGSRATQADGIVVGLMVRAGVTVRDGAPEYQQWRLLAHVAALLAGTGQAKPHAPGGRVGEALHKAGLSENRLLRLTAARGPTLHGQIVRAARFLAQSGQAGINLWTLFHLASSDPERAEQARVQIAREYYAAEARQGETTK